MASDPLVSCIMPTFNRRQFVSSAVRHFLTQQYARKELVIVDDGTDPVRDLLPNDSRVRYFRQEKKQPVGVKRNFACEQARGEIIVHWDDDDWSAPWRVGYQVEQLQAAEADICGTNRVLFYAPAERRAWEYVYSAARRPWVYGASLCYTKAFWNAHRFPDVAVGEDSRFIWADTHAKIHVLPDARFLIATVHPGNTSPKRTSDSRYRTLPLAEIQQLLDSCPAQFHDSKQPNGSAHVSVPRPSAQSLLVTAATGIGDVLRMTPLIRAAHLLGFNVDVLLAADYAETAQLLEGAPEIRNLFFSPSRLCRDSAQRLGGLADQRYDVTTFTPWTTDLHGCVQTRRAVQADRALWQKEGYSRAVEHLARELGWQGEMPQPFARTSQRDFGLAAGTIAIHPGCNRVAPWKRWHGFDELARHFPHVVLVGTEEDLENGNTYFRRDFVWPDYAKKFIGKLSLLDTAALIQQCSALVSNDSGLMQLGVVLGVPTFGIFGISSPQREGMPARNFFPITKGLPCEAKCRGGPWGRRDCERHLECLKTLSAEDVLTKMNTTLPVVTSRRVSPDRTALASPIESRPGAKETINLVYYGWVFDATGYGQAARGYIHALHTAGVNVSVVDLAGRPPGVHDPLVESLVGRKLEADFHLFHGIPPYWARRAFPLRNVIAMTVWETDTMPSQWRPALNHALEVWLPCDFNTTVFARALQKPVFKLPHACCPPGPGEVPSPELLQKCGIQNGEFVFYSIFEWQDRKGPREMIEAYLRAFPNDAGTLLVLKSNPRAAASASATLSDLRRQTRSSARVEIRCEAWSDVEVASLQARGDCYVSLHRGEGWNLPLFQAACLGKPVVATGFSGPMEYLDAAAHHLVRHQSASVSQRYTYYQPSMRWAEPEVAHAAELMRKVISERDAARSRAAAKAGRMRQDFSLETVGSMARQRLLHFLRRTNPEKWQRLHKAESQCRLKPPVPIPGEWYDADYFENGLKSNWHNGYSWKDFAGLFRETAGFLVEMFPEAETFLDAGCAKGFLVRALRERGKEAWGFDHSRWALDHAEEIARPFLHCQSADGAEFDRTFDITVCFSLLESLTQEEASAFLRRARHWTRQALVIMVLTCESDEERVRLLTEDKDLAHLSVHGAAWWQELVEHSGWRQDAVQRVAQRACQRHALPVRMGWRLFVCSAT